MVVKYWIRATVLIWLRCSETFGSVIIDQLLSAADNVLPDQKTPSSWIQNTLVEIMQARPDKMGTSVNWKEKIWITIISIFLWFPEQPKTLSNPCLLSKTVKLSGLRYLRLVIKVHNYKKGWWSEGCFSFKRFFRVWSIEKLGGIIN